MNLPKTSNRSPSKSSRKHMIEKWNLYISKNT
jgi:hypothetical protein